LNSVISVTFSEPVLNVTDTTFTVASNVSGSISGIVSTSNNSTWTFTPDSNLNLDEIITVTLDTAITDNENTALASIKTFTFNTKASTPPYFCNL